jgi:hypothetical protein
MGVLYSDNGLLTPPLVATTATLSLQVLNGYGHANYPAN